MTRLANLRVVDLLPDDGDKVRQTAALLHEGFLGRTQSWPTLESAREEVMESLSGARVNRLAVAMDEAVVGWVGAIPMDWYPGGVWELHPLVVARAWRRRGVGRLLMSDIEDRLRALGCRTVYLGTDDENSETSLSAADLYADLPNALANVQNHGGHPLGFYERIGYSVVGVLPDANGPGKPDIFMAKRL